MQIDKLIEQGKILMKRAIQEYEDADYAHAEISREQANRAFDKAYKIVRTDEGVDDLRYDESRNFGIIYKVFEENAEHLYKHKGQKKIANIINEIRNNNVLKEQFNYYNAILNPTNVLDEKSYTNEMVSIAPHYSKKELKENNTKLIQLFRKYKLDENIFIDEKDLELFESIEWTILNIKNPSNINEYIEKTNFLIESIKNNNKTINESKNLYQEKLLKLTEKYNNELNDDERSFLDEMTNPNTNKEKVFEDEKKSLLKKLDEMISLKDENLESYKTWKEKVSGKTFNESTCIMDIADFINVKNILNE